jgi:lipoate-protein ligase A
MATPRVFISSTYYDLKYVRDDIGNFIREMGYEPVMHDKGNITYTQITTLEQSCYDEISICDIVVCIIGSKYGTQASESDNSITMQELENAIKKRKKVYVFISNDVFIENNTYLLNKETSGFKPNYADDIRIHEFIAEIKEKVRNNPILPFNNVADIIRILKSQFAGLFQNLLSIEASTTDRKTVYDLQQTANNINDLVSELKEQKDDLFRKFNNTFAEAKSNT